MLVEEKGRGTQNCRPIYLSLQPPPAESKRHLPQFGLEGFAGALAFELPDGKIDLPGALPARCSQRISKPRFPHCAPDHRRPALGARGPGRVNPLRLSRERAAGGGEGRPPTGAAASAAESE